MATGCAGFVWDHAGGDGWVTPATYARLESEGLNGAATDELVDADRMRSGLAGYRPELGELGSTWSACTTPPPSTPRSWSACWRERPPRTRPTRRRFAGQCGRGTALLACKGIGIAGVDDQHARLAGAKVLPAEIDRRRRAFRLGEHAGDGGAGVEDHGQQVGAIFWYFIPASAVAMRTPSIAGIFGYFFGASGEIVADMGTSGGKNRKGRPVCPIRGAGARAFSSLLWPARTYVPKDKSAPRLTGKVRVALGLVMRDGQWRIASETSEAMK